MYGKIAAIVCTGLSILFTIWFVSRSNSHRRTGGGTGSDAGSVRDNIESARQRNSDIEAAERRTADLIREQAETVERAGQGNQDAQQLVKKAKDILHSAKRTSSNS